MHRFKVFLLLAATMLGAQEWALIGHPDGVLKAMSAKQIRAVYLGKRRFAGSLRLMPLQLSAQDPLRRQFEDEILKMSRDALREWWIRQHYLGVRPPKVMGSAEAVMAYVRKVEGAIGIVPYWMAADANVTILYYGEGNEK